MKLFGLIKQTIPGLLLVIFSNVTRADIWAEVEHGYAKSGDVKIHYATVGEGPLVIMIHGFPDFWYSWREQMEGLKSDFKVVAIDQRGYNKSDQVLMPCSVTTNKTMAGVGQTIIPFRH